MPKSKFVDFKAVKSAITMEQVLSHYNLLDTFKRSGDSLSGPCPIHKGSNPTQFRVSLSKNVWNCFSECKHGGNALDFIARMENASIHGAALKAVEWFHLDPDAMSADSEQDAEESNGASHSSDTPRPRPASSAPVLENVPPNKPLKFRLDKLEKEHPSLAKRGLTPETVSEFGIGFCRKGMMADRIAIPIHNVEGQVVAYAGRWPEEEPPEGTPKYKLPQGYRKSLELYNLDRAVKEAPENPLVIVEGFFGAMTLHQHGCRKVVALMGSTMSAAQEELIKRYTNARSQVIIMLDEDDAGRASREDIALRLARFVFVKVHIFAEEDMKPDDLSTEEVCEVTGGLL
jgi:DNA primase